MHSPQQRSGARVLVDQMLLNDVDTIFTVPGESFLDVLDSLHDVADRIRVVTCRMEAGAANMAEAYGKLTDRPGICMVTRGPGAAHAAVGVHTAAHDGTPMILFIGQVARSMRGRGAFQEVDFDRMFGSIAKWTVELDSPERIPELIARAFTIAVSGQPGPVVISMPEDVLSQLTATPHAPRHQRVSPAPSDGDMREFARLLRSASRPLLIAGGGSWRPEATLLLRRFAEEWGVPVVAAFRSQDAFDNESVLYAGDLGLGQNGALSERVRKSDLIIAAGSRLEETVTKGYSLIGVPVPGTTLVHIHPDTAELGRVYQPALAINASMEHFFQRAATLMSGGRSTSKAWAASARADYERFQEAPPAVGRVDLAAIMRCLRERLPDDAIVTNGAGNHTVWLHRFFRYRQPKTQLAPTSGAMGYGVPAAVAAKFLHPDRIVASVNGDGCFMMCGQEFVTAAQYGVAPIFIVVNNGMYGTIRMHQERNFPGRVIATDLVNPDFVAFARACRGEGELVLETQAFAGALERAIASRLPYLIELRLDPDALTPEQSLSAIRASK